MRQTHDDILLCERYSCCCCCRLFFFFLFSFASSSSSLFFHRYCLYYIHMAALDALEYSRVCSAIFECDRVCPTTRRGHSHTVYCIVHASTGWIAVYLRKRVCGWYVHLNSRSMHFYIFYVIPQSCVGRSRLVSGVCVACLSACLCEH